MKVPRNSHDKEIFVVIKRVLIIYFEIEINPNHNTTDCSKQSDINGIYLREKIVAQLE